MNDENTPKEKEVKRRFQSWLRPSTIKLMDRLYEDDMLDLSLRQQKQ